MSLSFDPKLMPLFDGNDSDQSVQERIEKVELICQLSGVQCIECRVPMHLSAFETKSQAVSGPLDFHGLKWPQ